MRNESRPRSSTQQNLSGWKTLRLTPFSYFSSSTSVPFPTALLESQGVDDYIIMGHCIKLNSLFYYYMCSCWSDPLLSCIYLLPREEQRCTWVKWTIYLLKRQNFLLSYPNPFVLILRPRLSWNGTSYLAMMTWKSWDQSGFQHFYVSSLTLPNNATWWLWQVGQLMLWMDCQSLGTFWEDFLKPALLSTKAFKETDGHAWIQTRV